MSADAIQGLSWSAITILAMVIGAGQQRRRVYYPANFLLGLAVAIPAVFYLGLLLALGTVAEVREVSAEYRLALVAYALQIVFLLWSAALVIRVGGLKAGDCIDLLGRLQPPTDTQIEDALALIGRAEKHDMLNAVTRRWLDEDLEMRRVVRLARERQEDNGRDLARDHMGLLWTLVKDRFWRPGRIRITKRLGTRYPRDDDSDEGPRAGDKRRG